MRDYTPETPKDIQRENKDINDAMARLYAPTLDERAANDSWPTITPLSTTLPPVEPFNYDLLPDGLSRWVKDVVTRTQCPPDFVAVTLMCGLACVVAGKTAIHPKQHDNWLVIPNLWGALIGRPSTMKSPALEAGLRPLKRLVAAAKNQYAQEIEDHKIDRVIEKQKTAMREQDIKKALKAKDGVALDALKKEMLDDEGEAPTERRYIVNDTTIEKLGEILNENPAGVLLMRDELSGWLKNLDREDKANDRAFYLECFGGGMDYTYDRIGRGTLHIESTTVSLIGGLQPAKLRPYVWHAINQGAGDDGLLQRLQLAVYPDTDTLWVDVDRIPNPDYDKALFDVFHRLDEIPTPNRDADGRMTGVRFDAEGQSIFRLWRAELEIKVRATDIHPAIESHLIKYRSLMPSLSLIINVVDEGYGKAVTERSARKAVAWCGYLESHAMRIYSGGIAPARDAAERIFKRRAKLPSVFGTKVLQQKGWEGLTEINHIKNALNELIESGYLRCRESPTGGRPTIQYEWNPSIGEKV